jgi:hypothetical protein
MQFHGGAFLLAGIICWPREGGYWRVIEKDPPAIMNDRGHRSGPFPLPDHDASYSIRMKTGV